MLCGSGDWFLSAEEACNGRPVECVPPSEVRWRVPRCRERGTSFRIVCRAGVTSGARMRLRDCLVRYSVFKMSFSAMLVMRERAAEGIVWKDVLSALSGGMLDLSARSGCRVRRGARSGGPIRMPGKEGCPIRRIRPDRLRNGVMCRHVGLSAASDLHRAGKKFPARFRPQRQSARLGLSDQAPSTRPPVRASVCPDAGIRGSGRVPPGSPGDRAFIAFSGGAAFWPVLPFCFCGTPRPACCGAGDVRRVYFKCLPGETAACRRPVEGALMRR
jgi:hypothetical protein